MARGGGRSSGGKSSFGGSRQSSPPPNRSTATAQPPVQSRPQAPAVQTQQGGGMLSGLASSFMWGIGMGAGSEVGHQAVRGLMGSGSGHEKQVPQDQTYQTEPQQQQQVQYCSGESQSFLSCLQTNKDISYCQIYSDALKECQKKYNL